MITTNKTKYLSILQWIFSPSRGFFPLLFIFNLVFNFSVNVYAEKKSFQSQEVKTNAARAIMKSKNGSIVRGTINFKEGPRGLEVTYKLKGLPKDKMLGMHIHENGDCSSPDAKSAGGHYIKVADTSGTSLDFPEKYAGDLPSIQSDSNGKASATLIVPDLTIDSAYPIKGRAIVIHDGQDDITANSAPRIACGKIEVLINQFAKRLKWTKINFQKGR